MNSPEPVNVIVKKTFSASPERVYDAWLDTEQLARWMFGPSVRDEEIVSLKSDGRIGGAFSFIVNRQGQAIDHAGEYLELDRPKRLVFTWGVPQFSSESSRVLIDIEPDGNGSRLTLTHELSPQSADFASRTEAGWTKMLDILNEVLAT